ncbi:MAG: flagellar FlbD family protein [Phycisphaerales bacterium]|nr:flagellar FlbD family protein [Phycisphaerales bacterium]
MITLHRLNAKPFILNAELIRTVEENPDTVITLISGDHVVVQEHMSEVVERAIEYRRLLYRMLPPAGAGLPQAVQPERPS